jgi:hypothetical protein
MALRAASEAGLAEDGGNGASCEKCAAAIGRAGIEPAVQIGFRVGIWFLPPAGRGGGLEPGGACSWRKKSNTNWWVQWYSHWKRQKASAVITRLAVRREVERSAAEHQRAVSLEAAVRVAAVVGVAALSRFDGLIIKRDMIAEFSAGSQWYSSTIARRRGPRHAG